MSIYDTEKVYLPQVKLSEWQKQFLYDFLKIFNRKYADFIRDICDAILKWDIENNRPTFNEHLNRASKQISQEYIKRDCFYYKTQCKKTCLPSPIYIACRDLPIKKTGRLPQVSVSQWQAENLYKFLATFSKSYADFVRMLCDNLSLNIIEAQAEAVEFSKSNNNIFKNTFDKIIHMEKLRKETEKPNQWPANFWTRRSLIKKSKST